MDGWLSGRVVGWTSNVGRLAGLIAGMVGGKVDGRVTGLLGGWFAKAGCVVA